MKLSGSLLVLALLAQAGLVQAQTTEAKRSPSRGCEVCRHRGRR